jgi:integrase
MAFITRLASGKLQVRYRVTVDGAQVSRKESFATRREAEIRKAEVERLYEPRGNASPPDLTLGELIPRYLKSREGHVEPTTLEGYRRNLAYLVQQLGRVKVRRITPGMLNQAFLQLRRVGGHQGSALAPRTVKHVRRAAHHLFRYARIERMITDNPVDLTEPVKVPTRQATTRAFSLAQAQQAMQAAGPSPWPQIIFVAVTTGLRRGEILGLAWRAIYLDGGKLMVVQACIEPKAGGPYWLRPSVKTESSAREVMLDAGQVAYLKAWRAEQQERCLRLGVRWNQATALVFGDADAGDVARPLRPSSVSGHLSYVAHRKLGIPAGVLACHGYRHTHGTELYEAGETVKDISVRLGHSDTRITENLYVKPGEARARRVAERAGVVFAGLLPKGGG